MGYGKELEKNISLCHPKNKEHQAKALFHGPFSSWDFFSSRNIYLGLSLYFAILLFLAPINILSLDTYYYWDWSRHLALSYYDGSPMIAYFIRLATSLFGDNLFALSSVGISVIAITSGVIYKTCRFFYRGKQARLEPYPGYSLLL